MIKLSFNKCMYKFDKMPSKDMICSKCLSKVNEDFECDDKYARYYNKYREEMLKNGYKNYKDYEWTWKHNVGLLFGTVIFTGSCALLVKAGFHFNV